MQRQLRQELESIRRLFEEADSEPWMGKSPLVLWSDEHKMVKWFDVHHRRHVMKFEEAWKRVSNTIHFLSYEFFYQFVTCQLCNILNTLTVCVAMVGFAGRQRHVGTGGVRGHPP